MTKIAVIIGSTRPGRIGPKVAAWFMEQVGNSEEAKFEIVDLLDYNLPILDEPIPTGSTKAHSKKWQAKLAEFDGYVLVTPEYNHALPGPLKNAIDFAGKQLHYKPIAYVSYGAIGGSRAVEQWRQVAAQFNQFDLRPQVMIIQPQQYIDEQGRLTLDKRHQESAVAVINAISFWARHMALARAQQ